MKVLVVNRAYGRGHLPWELGEPRVTGFHTRLLIQPLVVRILQDDIGISLYIYIHTYIHTCVHVCVYMSIVLP